MKGSCDIAIALNEHSIEVDESCESPYFRRIGWYRPVLDSLYLGLFYPDLSWRDFVAKEDCLRNIELALVLID